MSTGALRPTIDASPPAAKPFARLVGFVGSERVQVLICLFVGLATGLFRLGDKGLWGDEVWEVSWPQQQGFVETYLRLRVLPDLPLHYLLTKVATLVSTNEFIVRLPSLLLGVAAVVLLYYLGRDLFGKWVGLVAALLLAVAPYHVWYTQDARPYAGLACYSLLSLFCFCRLLTRPSILAFAGFTLATVLNLTNHLFGLFPLMVEGLAALVWLVYTLNAFVRSEGDARRQIGARIRRVVIGLAISMVIVILLTLPLYGGILEYIRNRAADPVPSVPFVPNAEFIEGLFGALGAGTGVWFYLFMGLALVGLGCALYRRQYVFMLMLAWLLVPNLVLWIAQPQHIFHIRYVLFLQPTYLLLVACGVLEVGRWLGTGGQRLLKPTGAGGMSIGRVVPVVLVLVLVGLTFVPTWRIYWVEKVNDWSGICAYLHRNVSAGDFVIGDDYIEGIEDWCFRMVPGAPAANISSSRSYDVLDLARRGQSVWYLNLTGQSRAAELAGVGFEQIPRTSWARSDLVPDTSDGTRLEYPQSEPLLGVLHFSSDQAAQHLVMKDVHGDDVVKGWPDYAQLNPGQQRTFRLGLAADKPGALRISYLEAEHRDLVLKVDGNVLTTLSGAGNRGWTTADVPLPDGLGNDFLLEITNVGTDIAAWSELQVIAP